MRFHLTVPAVVLAAGLTAACVTAPPLPTAVVQYARTGCAAQPDLARANSLTPEKEKAVHDVLTPVAATTPCLERDGVVTPYVVYRLPTDTEDKTFDVGATLEGQRIFAPSVALLDAQGAITRSFPREQYLYRGQVYSVQFRPRPEEAYVLVTAAPDLVGKAYDAIAVGTSTVYLGNGGSWTSGTEARALRTFSYEGTAQVSVFDSDTKEAAAKAKASK